MQDNEYPPQYGYQEPLYSHEPPRPRAQYITGPPPPPIDQPRDFPPPPVAPPSYFQQLDRGGRRGRSGYDSDDEKYYSDVQSRPRRLKTLNRRRSSSYHGPRDGQLALAGKRNGTMVDQAKDKAHRYGLKDELGDVFTKSKAGLAGGAVGAVCGRVGGAEGAGCDGEGSKRGAWWDE
jgi:hypothetical protein